LGCDLLNDKKYSEAMSAYETAFALFSDVNPDLERKLQHSREKLAEVRRHINQFQQKRGKLEAYFDGEKVRESNPNLIRELTDDVNGFFYVLKDLVELESKSKLLIFQKIHIPPYYLANSQLHNVHIKVEICV